MANLSAAIYNLILLSKSDVYEQSNGNYWLILTDFSISSSMLILTVANISDFCFGYPLLISTFK